EVELVRLAVVVHVDPAALVEQTGAGECLARVPHVQGQLGCLVDPSLTGGVFGRCEQVGLVAVGPDEDKLVQVDHDGSLSTWPTRMFFGSRMPFSFAISAVRFVVP